MANPYFNAVYYLQQNPDVFSAGYTVATAWDHYVKHGANEANVVGGTFRAPNPWFDVKYYLANNPDLVRAGITPATALDHFLTYGSTAGEDRAPNATIAAAPITEAKLLAYAKANADLQKAFGISATATTLTAAEQTSLLNHFYAYGYNETRADKPAVVVTPDANEGKTFTLTTNIENLTGTSGDDTFIAGSVGTTSTLNAGDQIDGAAGTDTLKLYDAANAGNFASAVIKNVEVVENYASSDLNVSGNADVQKVWQYGNAAAGTTTTAKATQTVGLSGTFAGLETVTFKGTDTSSDSATIALNGATTTAAGTTVTNGGAGNLSIESLTVQAEGKNTLGTFTNAGLQTLTVVGQGTLSATVAGTTTLKTIDATGNKGGSSITVANAQLATAGITVSGGEGKDSFTVTDALAKKAIVDLGAGDDTLSLTQGATAFAAGSSFNGGEGTDTLVLNNTTTAISATSGKLFTGFDAVKLTGTSTYTVGHIAGVTSYEIGNGTATFNNLSNGTAILVSGNTTSATLNLKAADAVDPAATLSVSLDNSAAVAAAGGVAQNGVAVASLATTARVLNVDSQGSVVSTSQNDLTIADTQSVGKINITGDQAIKVTTGANAVGSVDGSQATGKLEIVATASTGVDNAIFIKGGSANDTITASNTALITNTITGGLGADTINAGTVKSVIVLTGQADSTATAFDAVTNFTAGTDVINLAAFNIAASVQKVAVTTKATVDVVGATPLSSTFTITAANAAGFFTSGGVQNGVAVVVDSTTAADGAFAFIDVDGDGNWNAANDSVIALVGLDYSTITAASFAFTA